MTALLTDEERAGLITRLKDAAQSCHRPLQYPGDNTRIQLALLEAVGFLSLEQESASDERDGCGSEQSERVATPSPSPSSDLVKALEFYADPFSARDEYGDPVRVPDFYSELDFAETARSALRAHRGEK